MLPIHFVCWVLNEALTAPVGNPISKEQTRSRLIWKNRALLESEQGQALENGWISTHRKEQMGESRHVGRFGFWLPATLKSRHNTTTTGSIPMLTEIKSLPGSKCQATMADREGQRGADQDAFDMSRHLILTTEFCENLD
jgi:hypothetical protein